MRQSNRIQRLRNKLGHVRYDVTSRVATTISTIRDRSYAYAGFQTRQLGAGQEDSSDPADMCRAPYMLRKTIVRYMRQWNTRIRLAQLQHVVWAAQVPLKCNSTDLC